MAKSSTRFVFDDIFFYYLYNFLARIHTQSQPPIHSHTHKCTLWQSKQQPSCRYDFSQFAFCFTLLAFQKNSKINQNKCQRNTPHQNTDKSKTCLYTIFSVIRTKREKLPFLWMQFTLCLWFDGDETIQPYFVQQHRFYCYSNRRRNNLLVSRFFNASNAMFASINMENYTNLHTHNYDVEWNKNALLIGGDIVGLRW